MNTEKNRIIININLGANIRRLKTELDPILSFLLPLYLFPLTPLLPFSSLFLPLTHFPLSPPYPYLTAIPLNPLSYTLTATYSYCPYMSFISLFFSFCLYLTFPLYSFRFLTLLKSPLTFLHSVSVLLSLLAITVFTPPSLSVSASLSPSPIYFLLLFASLPLCLPPCGTPTPKQFYVM